MTFPPPVYTVFFDIYVEDCIKVKLYIEFEFVWKNLYTVHCTLYIVPCTLHTLHCILYALHCTLHTVHFTLYTVHWTLNTVHCTLYTVQYIARYNTLYSTLHTINCTVHYTVHTIHLILLLQSRRLFRVYWILLKVSGIENNLKNQGKI